MKDEHYYGTIKEISEEDVYAVLQKDFKLDLELTLRRKQLDISISIGSIIRYEPNSSTIEIKVTNNEWKNIFKIGGKRLNKKSMIVIQNNKVIETDKINIKEIKKASQETEIITYDILLYKNEYFEFYNVFKYDIAMQNNIAENLNEEDILFSNISPIHGYSFYHPNIGTVRVKYIQGSNVNDR